MKLFLATIICFFALNSEVYSQTFFQTYGGPANDEGWSILEDPNGNFVVAGDSGRTTTWTSNSQIILLKFDPNGNSFWHRHYGDADDQVARCVRQTIDGGFIFIGDDLDMSLLMKVDSTGDSLWSRLDYGGNFGGSGKSVMSLPNGSFVYHSDWDDIQVANPSVILKVDHLGQNIWPSFVGIAYSGGSAGPSSLIRSQDSCLIGVSSEMVGVYVRNKISITKISDSGNLVWNKTYDAGIDWSPTAIIETSDHSLMIVGKILNTYPQYDMFVMKCDSVGDSLWVKTYGGSNIDVLTDIKQTSDSGFITFGYSNSYSSLYDILLLRLDSQGDSLWQRTTGGPGDEFLNSGIICQNGNFAFTGSTTSYGAGNKDIIIFRTDSLGNFTTGIESHFEEIRTPFPNPFINSFNYEFETEGNKLLFVFDSFGKLMYENEGYGKQITVISSEWPAGIYFCSVSENNTVKNFKMVKVE